MFTFAVLAWGVVLALIALVASILDYADVADGALAAVRVAVILATAMLAGSGMVVGMLGRSAHRHGTNRATLR